MTVKPTAPFEMPRAAEMGAWLEYTAAEIHSRRRQYPVLGIRTDGRWRYPSFQLGPDWMVPGLQVILQSLVGLPPERVAEVLLTTNNRDESPLALLRSRDRIKAIVAAVRTSAEIRHALGTPPGGNIHPALDADLEADLRRDREIDAIMDVDKQWPIYRIRA
jgi:hypothetical protein